MRCDPGSASPLTHFRSLACVGPDVNFIESERVTYSFAIEEARRHGHKRAMPALRSIGEPPHDDTKRFMTRIRWVANFRGIHRGKGFAALVRTNLGRLWASPHYSFREKIGALRGVSVTQERVLPSLRGFDLLSQELRIQVPMAFFQGRARRRSAAPPHSRARRASWSDADLVRRECPHAPRGGTPPLKEAPLAGSKAGRRRMEKANRPGASADFDAARICALTASSRTGI
jgi:hypothetical protein